MPTFFLERHTFVLANQYSDKNLAVVLFTKTRTGESISDPVLCLHCVTRVATAQGVAT